MNELDLMPESKARPGWPSAPAPHPDIPEPPPRRPGPRGRAGRLFALAIFSIIAAALAFGVWQHYQQDREVAAAAEQQATFVPSVRVEKVAQHHGTVPVSLPGTTLAFEQADIYARTNFYVLKRNVDIGDHVKSGQLLAEITAPEVDYQVAQLQNSLQQAAATTRQNAANRSLAQA